MFETVENNSAWWKKAVIYHIYPRSFYDSNNDGVGDLRGIIKKFDYLIDLGIDAIWLSPIYKSPQVDFGYDVSDYRQIDKDYGNLNDFKELLNLCHSKCIKLIMDMVFNHTSDQHPWFINSRSSINSEKRDWYIWKKKKPNNWKSAFGKSAWRYDKATKEYYYHSFFAEQPDLNWRNKEVKKAMFDEVKFWLDLGVDGFRLDVINYIVKDKKFRNDPSLFNQLIKKSRLFSRNRGSSIKITAELRELIDTFKEKIIIGEIYVLPPGDSEMVANYLGKRRDALNLAFDFSLLFSSWSARKFYQTIDKMYKNLNTNAWATIVFSNHDLKRSFSKPFFKKQRLAKAKLKAMLMMTLLGTPFVYYGEEIGMENGKIPKKDIKDRLGKRYWPIYKGRDAARTPMQWNTKQNAGFSETQPWLPVNKNYERVNIETQLLDKGSILIFFKALIKLRKSNKVLQVGDINLISYKNNVLIFERFIKNKSFTIVLNFSSYSKKIDSYINNEILISTHSFYNLKPNGEYKLQAYEGLIIET